VHYDPSSRTARFYDDHGSLIRELVYDEQGRVVIENVPCELPVITVNTYAVDDE